MDPSGIAIPDRPLPSVRLGFLGPLVVEIDGVERPIAARRQRALLVRLALEPGRAVSADRLLDDVWGDAHPATGRKSVAYQVSRLRSALDPDRAAGSVIVTSAAGYTLDVACEDVDVLRFDRLAAEARAAVSSDPARCVAVVGEALALWRGAALGDLGDEPFVEHEIRRLEEQRLELRSMAAEACIELGRAPEAIVDLIELIDERPLDEAAVGLLMVALDRVGRPGDALRAYGDLRRRLAEELGIGPAEWLQRLEGDIIAGSTASHPLGPSTASKAGPVPVPTALSSFVGRHEEIAEVTAALSVSRLVTLCGFGGIGKTRLAQEVARHLAEQMPVWYVELVPVTDVKMLADAIARVGGLSLPAGADPVERVTSGLRDRDVLVVLDSCEHLVDAVAELVTTVLPVAPGIRVLATSRVGLGVADELDWSVPALDAASAAQLFADRARVDLHHDAATTDLVARLVARLDGVPLAIEMAAARSSVMGLVQIDAHLPDLLRTPDGRRDRDQRQRSLDAVLDWNYRLLDPDDRTLLRRLSTCVGGFDLDAAIRIGSTDAEATELLDRLAHLVETSMVVVDDRSSTTPRYRLLEVVRRFASERLPPAEADDASARHAAHYRAVAAEVKALCDIDFRSAVRLGEREIGNLRAAMRWELDRGDPRRALAIALDARSFFSTHWLSRESLEWLMTGLRRTEGDDDARLLAAAMAVTQASNLLDTDLLDTEARRIAVAEVEHGLRVTCDPRVRAELLNAVAADESDTAPRAAEAHTAEALALDAFPPHRTLALLTNLVADSWLTGSIDGDAVLGRLRDLPAATLRSNSGAQLVEVGVAARAGRWDDVVRISGARPPGSGHAELIGLVRAEALAALGSYDEAAVELDAIESTLSGPDRWLSALVDASIQLRRNEPERAARRLQALADEVSRDCCRPAIGMQVAALQGAAAVGLRQPEVAATMLGHAAGERSRLDIDLRISDRELVGRAVEECRARLGAARYDVLAARGTELAFGELPRIDVAPDDLG